ncbi:hypothetical protein ACWC0A_30450 [Streptomyces scopuliridis]
MQYESDERAIARAIEALADGETIDHGTARAIAAGFTDGGDTVNYSFVSTGAMPTDSDTPGADVLHSLYRGVDAQTLSASNEALLALDYYLEDREAAGDTDRVDGWSDMWVLKHVDRPHETGTLPDCFACDTED